MSKLNKEKFKFLSLNSIKPRGWLKEQLQIQAEGLSGYLDEFWEEVSDNKWLGGKNQGREFAPYYLDGLLPLAYLLDDERLKVKAQKWIDAFLDYQDEDGWIGPVKTYIGDGNYLEYDQWPSFVVYKVLIQYYSLNQDERVVTSMKKFCRFLLNNLDEKPLFLWGKFRWADLVYIVHWLYEKIEEEWLLELAEKVSKQGYDWKEHFSNFKYTKKQEEILQENHVVNQAMAIKTGGVWFRQTGEDSDLKSVYQAIEILDRFHGQVTGVFTGDEHLSGKNPSQGTELCAVVEYMFSLEYLISLLADPTLADLLELITFNALPATMSPDMWSHQYDQQANQVICSVAEKEWTNDPAANIFGLEPNFGCCTANLHQGWPKFANSLWMSSEDGLAAVAYAPSEVSMVLGNGQKIRITEDTYYPFEENIRFKVNVDKQALFKLSFRIPAWTEKAQMILPDGRKELVQGGIFYQLEREWQDGDVIELIFPMSLEVERRYNGSAAIKLGPLVYSLKIGEEWKQIGGVLPHADWEIYPTTPWSYGLCLDLENPENSIKIERKSEVSRPFYPENAPVKLKVKGKYLSEWKLEGSRAGEIPNSPVRSKEKIEELTLIPYGSTNLRITEFPIIYDD